MITLYDSTTASDIPTTAQAVAGYVNGSYRWTTEDWARFPNVPKLMIDVKNEGVGHVLDVEQGDAVPTDAPGWVAKRRDAGTRFPIIYCSLSVFPAVRAEFARQGVPEGGYWIAHYTGTPHQVSPPASLVQYDNEPHSGGHYDLSCVFDTGIFDQSSAGLQPAAEPVPAGPLWLVQYIPASIPAPEKATWDQLVTVTVHAPDAATAEGMIPPGARFARIIPAAS